MSDTYGIVTISCFVPKTGNRLKENDVTVSSAGHSYFGYVKAINPFYPFLLRDYKIPISVRSGGHSYTCMSIRHDSLHFDMRRLKKVDLLKRTGYEVRRKNAISLGKVI